MDQIMRLLSGLASDHLIQVSDSVWLHIDVVEPFMQLRQQAAREGIDLVIASGHRDFERQLAIWNGKALGKRPVYSRDGSCQLDISRLSGTDLVFAILRWSALPGASRHHWGTDMDVWDAGAVEPDYRLQLTPEEYSAVGPFARLGEWLQHGDLEKLGFFRPYESDKGGVSPEPWHLSYRPLADIFYSRLSISCLRQTIANSEIELKDVILDNLDEIYQRFVQC